MDGMALGVITSVTAFAFAAGSPGPATLAVAGTAMARGRRHGLAMALGLSLSLGLWGGVAGLGFGALIAHYAPALLALKLIGAGYLFYLAWKSGRAAMRPDEDTATPLDQGRYFWRGVWLNLLNPKAVLAWIAALALGSGSALTIGLCALVGLALYLFYATVFSFERVMEGYARARRWIEAFFAGFFALAGVRLLFWKAAPGP